MKKSNRKQSRQEKIKALLDFSAGKVGVEQLRPRPSSTEIWRLTDGVYRNAKKGVALTETEFKQRPRTDALDIIVVRRREPSNINP